MSLPGSFSRQEEDPAGLKRCFPKDYLRIDGVRDLISALNVTFVTKKKKKSLNKSGLRQSASVVQWFPHIQMKPDLVK